MRGFLISQGVQPESITSQGYGESDPAGDNATAAGRAENRRVELVVSGKAIGVQQQAPTQSNSQPEAPAQNEQPAPPRNPAGISNPPPQ